MSLSDAPPQDVAIIQPNHAPVFRCAEFSKAAVKLPLTGGNRGST